jgi:hypothetical protein
MTLPQCLTCDEETAASTFASETTSLPFRTESDRAFAQYFRCPSEYARFEEPAPTALGDEGFFVWRGGLAYGRCEERAECSADDVPSEAGARHSQGNVAATLPFNLGAVVSNLREERYVHRNETKSSLKRLQRALYYCCRPALPVAVRKHLQKLHLKDWKTLDFPRWPVDVSVDAIMRSAMGLQIEAHGGEQVPFIWFWPDGAEACVMMTHDVEGVSGRRFADDLMDLDASFGIKAAFQIIPRGPRAELASLIDRCRARGFEVNLHDLHHDGRLFSSREEFRRQSAHINQLAREHQCHGFRAGAMYREQAWYDAFDFSFDMSVPNVAHLEPQRGGCCTVMPYFVGRVVELPLTTTQDYSLFHILNKYSTTLWMEQMDLILEQHGLISFIVHPDYVREKRALSVYRQLLEKLSALRVQRRVWVALPGEIDSWWRSRSSMSLVRQGQIWRIRGPESHRARVAYASVEGDRVVYEPDRQGR